MQELVKRIREELPNIEPEEADQVNKHFDNTVAHIKVRQEAGNEPTFKNLLAWLTTYMKNESWF